MYGKQILCAMSLILACNAFAIQLTPKEALTRLNGETSYSKGNVSQPVDMQLAYSSSFNGNNTYYVFNKGNNEGFVILSADDCMPAVLGEVDGTDFDMNRIPANMKWWLSEYDRSISGYIAKGKNYVSATQKTDISPLLKRTAWDQIYPYNAMCPKDESGVNLYTGCSATAMAQIMRKHQWPKNGTGKFEYTQTTKDETNGNVTHEVRSADFGSHTYDWNNMLDSYNNEYSASQKDAVALLMSDCGIGAVTSYQEDGSYAYSFNVLHAMVYFFNYDHSARLLSRLSYNDDEWENLIYEDLQNDLPVLYSGRDTNGTGGHAFVCDGYRTDGNMFHINWGWGGEFNGYFLLTGSEKEMLFPNQDLCYTDYQTIIKGLKPASRAYTPGQEGAFQLYAEGQLNCYKSYQAFREDPSQTIDVIDRDKDGHLLIAGQGFYINNSGFDKHKYIIGFRFENDQHKYHYQNRSNTIEVYSGIAFNMYVDLRDIMKNGTYTITPIYKDITAGETEWQEIILPKDFKKPVIKITGNEADIYISSAPKVISSGKTTEDNQVKKLTNSVDLNIQLKITALRTISNGEVVAYIFPSAESGTKSIGYLREEISNMNTATSKTINLTPANSHNLSTLKVGETYIVEFFQRTSNNDFKYLAKTQFNTIEIKIVDTVTGIKAVEIAPEDESSDNGSSAVYDLSGRKVSDMKKGNVYIVDGKKIVK